MSNKYKISIGIIEALKNQGMSQREIADLFGISEQAVSYHKYAYNGSRTPREIVLQHFPWSVPAPMAHSSPYHRLRDHGEYMATAGKGMSDDKLRRLRSFYRKLRNDNVVLEFDPAIPPIPGVSNKGGFAYRPRVDSDGELLIRVNTHTTLTDEGRLIWCWPPKEP